MSFYIILQSVLCTQIVFSSTEHISQSPGSPLRPFLLPTADNALSCALHIYILHTHYIFHARNSFRALFFFSYFPKQSIQSFLIIIYKEIIQPTNTKVLRAFTTKTCRLSKRVRTLPQRASVDRERKESKEPSDIPESRQKHPYEEKQAYNGAGRKKGKEM